MMQAGMFVSAQSFDASLCDGLFIHPEKSLQPSKSTAIPEGERDTIAEGVQEIVFALALFISDAEAFDLIQKVVCRTPFVDEGLVKRVLTKLHIPAVYVA